MSLAQNTEYLDEKWTELMEMVKERNFEGAEAVAKQVEDAGFPMVANELRSELEKEKRHYEADMGPDDFTHADGVENF